MSPRRLTILAAFTIGMFLACAVAMAQDTTQVQHHVRPNRVGIEWGADTVIPVHTIYVATGSPAMKTLDAALLTTKVEMLFVATEIHGYAETESTVDSVFEITKVRQCSGIGDAYGIWNSSCGADHAAPTIHLHLWRHDCGPSRTDLRSQIEEAVIEPKHRVDLTYCTFNSGGTAYWVNRNPLTPARWSSK